MRSDEQPWATPCVAARFPRKLYQSPRSQRMKTLLSRKTPRIAKAFQPNHLASRARGLALRPKLGVSKCQLGADVETLGLKCSFRPLVILNCKLRRDS